MLEQLKYKNHLNEVFEFGKDGIFVDTNELHDYEWEVTEKNNKISSISHGIRAKSLPIKIMCETESEGIAARNRLMEVTEKDVLTMQPGMIIIGNYYFKCYVTKSKKKDYLTSKRYLKVELTLKSDKPYWVKETEFYFTPESAGSAYLDYPFDYSYDFSSGMTGRELNNTGFVETNFKIIIYGACSNPAISIGGHVYQVNCTIDSGEYLTIDSTSKRIFLTANNGTVTNKFNDRNKSSYVFKKLPAGRSAVTWTGAFNFSIVVMEERSEPKWI